VKEFGTGALKYLVRFEFLEYAVYGECLEHCPVAMHSFKIPIGKRSRDPEIDVVFSIGYELWCVSCTVDDTSSLCYHKGAEILHHARRFGGDGARALLICLADVDTTSELAGLLKRNMGTASPMIRVWGRCEVADLKTQISKLFTQEGTKPCACS